MSLSETLTALQNARGAFVSALGSKGVQIESSATLIECASAIANIDQGADVTLGYVDSNGKFQPVVFHGSNAYDSGAAETVSSFYTWETPQQNYNMVVSSGTATINSGNTVGILVKDGGLLYVNGGTASNIFIESGGTMDLTSGNGSARAVVIYSGGSLIDPNSKAEVINDNANIIISGGSYQDGIILPGDTVSNLFASGGTIDVFGTVNSAGVEDFGDISVYDGGTVNHAEINYGFLTLKGGAANSTTINDGCELNIHSGTANMTQINNGGLMHIYSGGVASNTWVNSNAIIHISSGGSADNLYCYPGANIIDDEGAIITNVHFIGE